MIDIDTWIIRWHFGPNHLNHFPRIIQPHFPVYDIPKQAFPVLGANGHKIRTSLGIIVTPQSHRMTMVDIRTVFHDNNPFCFSNRFNLSSGAHSIEINTTAARARQWRGKT
ncbi:MAG: hypothetical protein P1P74_03855 [Desulfuromonadales bacterium]|nr:hypothetical protein [Desulfuromonadales bacterium]MDT8422146.1 hypothetical protein [Desulfuromonadales bacterium]